MTAPDALVLTGIGADLGGRRVLDGVSASLPAGCLAAIVGPNGAGKTSLLRSIAGLLPHRGSVSFREADLARLDRMERARTVAYLPQAGVAHWPLPVRDIVALGRFPHGAADPARLTERDAAAVTRAMAAADVASLADRPVTELSGGERARVALARVFAVEAPLILVDEPTAALDPRHQIEIMQLLAKAAAEGRLVIAVTHDLGLAARFCDRILVLQSGRLVTAGDADQALAPSILATVFGIGAFRTRFGDEPVLVPWTADLSDRSGA